MARLQNVCFLLILAFESLKANVNGELVNGSSDQAKINSKNKRNLSPNIDENGKFHVLVKAKTKRDVKDLMSQMSISNLDDRADIIEIKIANTVAIRVDQTELDQLQNDPNFIVEHVHQYKFLGYKENNMEEHVRKLNEHMPWGVPRVLQDVEFWENLSMVNASSKKLCIVDSGYDLGHEDLPKSEDVIGINKTDDNSFWGYDFVEHGTHVAGIATALGNNNIGVSGVIPNNQDGKFQLIIAKLSDGMSIDMSDALSAIEQCVNEGADVISMSFGCTYCYSQITDDFFKELYDRGILLVAAAGNDPKEIDDDYYMDDYYMDDYYYDGEVGGYPASYPAVLSVASSTFDNIQSDYSTANSQVEVSAPGQWVLSTLPNNRYGFLSGTSMATPHVAAVASLLWMHFPNCTNNDIRNILSATALDIEDEGCDERSGHGVIQAKDAYDLLNQGNCAAEIGAKLPIGGCGQLVKPCQSNVECDDGDSCTEDTCDLATGFCANEQLPCGDCGKKTFQIDILNDLYPQDVSWDVQDSDGNMIKAGKAGSKPNALHTEEMCLENGSYVFTIKDEWGGICCSTGDGVISLYIDDIKIYENKKFDTNEEVVPFDVTDFVTSFPTSAPTVCNEETVTVKVKTDDYAGDTYWDIKLGKKIVHKSDPYKNGSTKYSDDMCLEDGVYLFTIYDFVNDGICCTSGEGFYKLIVGGKTIKSGGEFKKKEKTKFVVGDGTLPPKKKKKKGKKEKSNDKKKQLKKKQLKKKQLKKNK